MKILLIGPNPPPHGGISTHVSELRHALRAAGTPCRVLNSARVGLRFALNLARYGIARWSFHVHTNGHNRNSWLLAGMCGLAGIFGRGCALTLHSGMAPGYVSASFARRQMARLVCALFPGIVCVSEPIRDSLAAAGVPPRKLEVRPAFLELRQRRAEWDGPLKAWMRERSPVLAATLFFRPEYGFDLLISAIGKLRRRYPSIGCVVMGGGPGPAVRAPGLEDNILLAGDLDHDMCLSVMAHSHLFLRPTYVDGDSISVREALALGVPVVASNAAARPPGVVLFETGDEDDLCAKVELALRVAVKERGHAIA
ncbi:MAG TPA: glycosyltransferase family 4 protein [Bryobacteraceae bacterium]|jgi:glycosyltransferase involved in cell wall biosynthesis